jgi:hypothetical protein
MRHIQIRALKNLKKALLSALAVLTLTLGFEVKAGPINPPCSEITGTFIFTSFTFLNPELSEAEADAEIWMDGSLAGYAHAHYIIDQKGNGVLQATFSHTWTFADGTVHTQDEGVVLLDRKNPGWGRVNSRLHIVDGTGAFAGATGLVHTHGEVNLFTLEGGIDFKGQICVPE